MSPAPALDEYLDGLLATAAADAAASPAAAPAPSAQAAAMAPVLATEPAAASVPATAAPKVAPPSPRPPSPAAPMAPTVRPAKAAPVPPTAPRIPAAATVTVSTPSHDARWLRLRCGPQAYGLELLKVQEVVLPTPLLRLRGTAPAMLGVMNLRGQVVPVIDLGLKLGGAAIEARPESRFIVLEENGETLGLYVSAVEDVATLRNGEVEPPDHSRIGRISNALFRGVARQGGRPVILLDAAELLADP